VADILANAAYSGVEQVIARRFDEVAHPRAVVERCGRSAGEPVQRREPQRRLVRDRRRTPPTGPVFVEGSLVRGRVRTGEWSLTGRTLEWLARSLVERHVARFGREVVKYRRPPSR
jgi:hypothetical protein